MVGCCVANGCSNISSETISLFQFPKDQSLREKWTKQVQRTCSDWTGPSESVTTQFSAVNIIFFFFFLIKKLASQFGIKRRRKLKGDAIPSVFNQQTSTSTSLESRKRSIVF